MRAFTACNIYLLLLFLYFSQGPFLPDGSLLSQSLLVLILLFSFWYTGKVMIRRHKPVYAKVLFIFVATLTAYCFIQPYTGKADNITQLKAIYLSLFPFFPAYYFTKQGKFGQSQIVVTLFVLLLTNIFSYFYNYNQMLGDAIARGSRAEEFTNNLGYTFVYLMPLLCLINKQRLLQFILIFICYFFIFTSAKRGAILTGTLCVFFTLYGILKSRVIHRKQFSTLLLIAIFLFAGYSYFKDEFFSSDQLQSVVKMTQEGNSSGRDVLYTKLWNYWSSPERPFYTVLFGSGYSTTIEVTGGRYAHNDWLELLVNCGLLGVFLYLLLYLSLLHEIRMRRHTLPPNLLTALYLVLFINFMQSFFSMSYMEESHFVLSLLLGYLLAYKNLSCNDSRPTLPR